jgi:hypothetical protein
VKILSGPATVYGKVLVIPLVSREGKILVIPLARRPAFCEYVFQDEIVKGDGKVLEYTTSVFKNFFILLNNI